MKRITIFFLLAIIIPVLTAQEVDIKKGLIANYPLDGKTGDLTGKNKNGKIFGAVATTGRDGKEGGAFRFKAKGDSYITLPVSASPDKVPIITVTAWVQATGTTSSYPLIACGINKETRSVYMNHEGSVYHWYLNGGGDGAIMGPAIFTKKWVFVAMMYDDKNKEARFVVGSELFKGKASIRSGDPGIMIGNFDGDIDELRVYDRFLNLAELESLAGGKINATQEDLVTVDRYAYKKDREKAEAAEVQPGDVYIINTSEFVIHDSAGGWGQKALLKQGDTLRVDSVIGKYLKVIFMGGEYGYVSRGTLQDNAYPEGDSSLGHSTKVTMKHIFDFTSIRSWIIVVVCALILFMVKKKFLMLDEMLNKLRKKDMYSSGGSKSGAMAVKRTVLDNIFPIERLRWWPIIPGAIAGIALFIALMVNSGETEWFFAQGFHLIPAGYDKWVHWLLFSMVWMLIFAFVAIALESYVVTGPIIMWLRIFILIILNLMAFAVAIYLAVVVVVISIVMLVLTMLGSGSSNYKCPHCGGTFSGSRGSSYTCPHCGGGVST